MMKRFSLTLLCLIFLAGCGGQSKSYAPVATAWRPQSENSQTTHRVRKGETLYAIAWRHDMDFRQLAEINRLAPPYALTTNGVLKLKANASRPQKKVKSQKIAKKGYKARTNHKSRLSNHYKADNKTIKSWHWPVKGKVLQQFSPKTGSKGIDIAGRHGQSVHSTAAGRVAYSGTGLRAYGKLLIIKHNNTFLSAYAHNRKVFVKEGDWVKEGQRIAEMGNSGAKRVMLHFELRKAGKPVNPMYYLKNNKNV